MNEKIQKLLNDIRIKKENLRKDYDSLRNKYDTKLNDLWLEYQKLKEKYEFKVVWKEIIWNKDRLRELRKYRKSVLESIFSATVREIFSIPFIWMMLIPAIFLDICLFIYQNTAIRLYKIPLAKRSDYIVFDRSQLVYLNWIQKIDCIYCSYVNWLFQYWVEVAWRTEKYWCPIKHATKKHWTHNWEKYFAEYWDSDEFNKVFWKLAEFNKLKNRN